MVSDYPARSHDGRSLDISHQSESLSDTKELEGTQFLLQRIYATQIPDHRRYDEYFVPGVLRRKISFQPPILCALLVCPLLDTEVVRDRDFYDIESFFSILPHKEIWSPLRHLP